MNLYHSALVSMGLVTVSITTGPMKSKFSKPNAPKPDYCGMVINGEEFSYTIENPTIAAFITQHKGQTLSIVAEGSRDQATITAVGAPASQMQQPAPRQAPPAHQPPPQHQPQAQPSNDGDLGPAAGQPKDATHDLKHFMARNRVMAIMALEAAWLTKLEFEAAKKYEMTDEVFIAIYNSMLFGSNGAGFSGLNKGIPLDYKFKPTA